MYQKKVGKHIVILGYNVFAQKVILELLNAKQSVTVVTEDQEKAERVKSMFQDKVKVVRGFFTDKETLKKVRIQESLRVLINVGSDEDCLLTILNIKKTFEGLNFVVILNNDQLKKTFMSAGVSYVLSKESITAKIVTSYLYEEHVAEIETEFMQASGEAHDYDIQQYLIQEGNTYENTSYGDLFWELKNKHNILLVGLSEHTPIGTGKNISILPDHKMKIKADTYVFVITSAQKEPELEKMFGVTEGVKL